MIEGNADVRRLRQNVRADGEAGAGNGVAMRESCCAELM